MKELLIEYFRRIFWETKDGKTTFDAEALAEEFIKDMEENKNE